ncbi:hypothetical protein [Segatella copri]|uniref:hypothetical protein n=2 Tax=Segatella copri TaxID=165179 RepID=UPI0012911605|nr:hypothetical protein [Segatella copri]MCW4080071.1 hypothetical protein [Segatella copri]MCW4104821.1 hypothetical protein [Segatella copri]MQN66662.1 hypothetical protein [Segatella copri]MQO22420.1 hypothetical protein [Segatella copri]MQO36754.1 hypothetical protein [Segatella copri]
MDYDKQPINVDEQVALQIIPILIYMPWAFHKDGKTNLYGDSSLVFGLTHFSYTTKNHLAELCEIPLTFLPYCVKENNSSFCGA